MSGDKPLMVMLDLAEKHEGIPDMSPATETCPTCGGRTEVGFGMAGGGYGPYHFCPRCEAVVAKSALPLEES